MSPRNNPAKDRFIQSFPESTVESLASRLNGHLRFSLSFFDYSQPVSQNFEDWSHEQLSKLLHKLQHYSGNTKEFWQTQRVGAGSLKVLEIYGEFPSRSEFAKPKHVPIDARWARFRLESDMRLIGFLLPANVPGFSVAAENTFFVVFLDQHHKFYLPEDS